MMASATSSLNCTAISFCMITTAQYHSTRVLPAAETWARNVPLTVITDGPDASTQQRLEQAGGQLVVARGCSTSHRIGVCCKFSFAVSLILRNRPGFAIFLDDDTFVHVPNLLELIKQQQQQHAIQRPLFMGNAWCRSRFAPLRSGRPFVCGGGGFVLSSAALRRLQQKGDRAAAAQDSALTRTCRSKNIMHDAALSWLLEERGVRGTHSNRFHWTFRPPNANGPPPKGVAWPVQSLAMATHRERQEQPPRPATFHLKAQPAAHARELHARVCTTEGRLRWASNGRMLDRFCAAARTTGAAARRLAIVGSSANPNGNANPSAGPIAVRDARFFGIQLGRGCGELIAGG